MAGRGGWRAEQFRQDCDISMHSMEIWRLTLQFMGEFYHLHTEFKLLIFTASGEQEMIPSVALE